MQIIVGEVNYIKENSKPAVILAWGYGLQSIYCV